jgi:hypothetical protein
MREHTEVRAAHYRKAQTLASALERDARQRNAIPITLASIPAADRLEASRRCEEPSGIA